MQIRPEEITSVLKKQIAEYTADVRTDEVGTVIMVGDGIARVHGLDKVQASELVEFPGQIYGMAMNLEEDNVGCVLFGSDEHIKEGDIARRTGRLVDIPVGEGMIGRVINPLGFPLDGKGEITFDKRVPIERKGTGVVTRQPVSEPLQTGIKAIDSMIPIGRGQRELIIGDRQTGKTTLAVDTIINQKGKDVICIYVAIGQKNSTIANVVKTLEDHGALEHTIIISSTAVEPAPIQYLAPFAGAAIGEYFRDKGMHALCVYDDLTKHAWAYRQLSLLLRRPPGREAYPGDVFYLHSRLLERSAKLRDDLGGGSLTALPIIETQAGDVSAYIPTNVISITDGQIFLETELFYSGQRPALNVGISVSRVGGHAQTKAMKQVAGRLKSELAQYRSLQAFAMFAGDLDKVTMAQLNRGARLMELMKQPQFSPVDLSHQVVIFWVAINGYLDTIAVKDVKRYMDELISFIQNQYADLFQEIEKEKNISDELEAKIRKVVEEFKGVFQATA
ncbi:MAG: F0F1 ATP synthase subunit alpha [bacterium]